jgi:hypothetical protein
MYLSLFLKDGLEGQKVSFKHKYGPINFLFLFFINNFYQPRRNIKHGISQGATLTTNINNILQHSLKNTKSRNKKLDRYKGYMS